MSKIPTITCAADVIKAFPHAEIDAEGIWSNGGGLFLNCHPDELILDGAFTPEQVLALAYWLSHKSEFAAPGEDTAEPADNARQA
jgi:hypothetical protein